MNWITIKSQKDFWAGVMYIAFGLATVIFALDYNVGTTSRMGPGYFPRGLGALTALLGLILVIRGMRVRGPRLWIGPPKPLLVVLGSVIMFGLAVPVLGLAVATVLLVIVSSTASHEFRWRETLIAALALAVFAVGAFDYALGVQMPVWPPFLQA